MLTRHTTRPRSKLILTMILVGLVAALAFLPFFITLTAQSVTWQSDVRPWNTVRFDDVIVNNTLTATGGQSKLGNLDLAVLSPAAISGTVNDWTPTNWTAKATTTIEASLSATTTLNGLAALNQGAGATICNMSGTFDLTIVEEAAASAAANRFTNGGGNIKLAHHTTTNPQCASYRYSSGSRWVLTGTTASTIPSLTLLSGLSVQSSGAQIAGGLSATLGGGPFTTNTSNLGSTMSGTFDTTAGAIQGTGMNCIISSTKSAGANPLTNVCGQFSASGGDVNQALVTTTGDVVLNQTSGTSTVDGALTIAGGATISTGTTVTWTGATIAGGATLSGNNTISGATTSSGNVSLSNLSHLRATGTSPTLSGCGTGPTVTGSDVAGTVAEGTGATGCTVTFRTTFGTAPTCVVSPESLQATFSYTPSAATLTLTNTSQVTFDYVCIGH